MSASKMKTEFDRIQWMRKVVAVVRSFKSGIQFTSDEVRHEALKRGIGVPPNPNNWGRAVQSAKTFMLAWPTGVYRPTSRAAGHRRAIAVWKRL